MSRPQGSREWVLVWLWVGVIFSSIPLARRFQEWVSGTVGREALLLPVVFCIVLGVVWGLLYLIRKGRRDRFRRGVVLGLCAAGFAFWTWHLRRLPEEALHFIQYGVLSLFVLRAYAEQGKPAPLDTLRSFLFCTQVGILDEIIQWIVPKRYFDFRDILLNAAAAFLILSAVQWGLREASNRRAGSRARLAVHHALGRLLLMFCILLNLTPSALYALRNLHPVFEKASGNPSTVAEYGFLHTLDGVGEFRSRLPLEKLRSIDRDFAEQNASILDKYHDVKDYAQFQKDWPPSRDAFIHEMRVHLFSREHHRHRTWESKRQEMPEEVFRAHVRTAHFEQKILERVFSETLNKSGYHLSAAEVARLGSYVDFEPDFVSRVSKNLIVGVSQTQVNVGLALAGLGWIVRGRRLKRRKESHE